jgi:hypothetical protein
MLYWGATAPLFFMKKYIATILPLFLVACGAPSTAPDNSEIISKAEEACLTTFPGEVMSSVDTKEFGITFVDTGDLTYGECEWDAKTGEITNTMSSETLDKTI